MTPDEPVFILALPRSFGSLVGAMLGQHPQLYGLPETHLFGCENVAEWCDMASRESFNMADGLVRAIAQIYFRKQDEIAVVQARAWLRRRLDFTTGYLLETLAEAVNPRILMEKSPSIVYSLASMQRAYSMFPLARFIHLAQHPRGYGETVMKGIHGAAECGPVPEWMLSLASFTAAPQIGALDGTQEDLDPQRAWYALNSNICKFLEAVPDARRIRIRGEDLLRDPDRALCLITDWMGLNSDSESIELMKHPEQSPYAFVGPRNALYGDDYDFLVNPSFTPVTGARQKLDGMLDWRSDGTGFSSEVKELARQFGYK
jgi:Sulfotransferase family